MAQRLTVEEKAAAATAARAAELARRPEAGSIAVYIGDVRNEDGTVTYHAVIRVDASVPLTDPQLDPSAAS